jgi:hypothetical protein
MATIASYARSRCNDRIAIIEDIFWRDVREREIHAVAKQCDEVSGHLGCFDFPCPLISYFPRKMDFANVVDMAGCSEYSSDHVWQISPVAHGGVSKIPHFFHPA